MKKGIIAAVCTVAGITAGTVAVWKKWKTREAAILALSNKHLALFFLMNQWVKVKQENKSIGEYLRKKGYENIAIYGMNYAGETLLDELAGSVVEVKYGIDRNADSIYLNVDIVSPEESLEDVDAIIVTAITYFDEIAEQLVKKTNAEILSLEDILNEI